MTATAASTAITSVSLAVLAAVALASGLGAFALAGRVAALATRHRWWLSRWAQAGAVALVVGVAGLQLAPATARFLSAVPVTGELVTGESVTGGLVTAVPVTAQLVTVALLAPAWAAATLACLVDLACHRLPDVLTVRAGSAAGLLALIGGSVGVIGVARGGAGLDGVGGGAGTTGMLVTALLAALTAAGILGLLVLISPASMGLGDVKLAALLGLPVGVSWAVRRAPVAAAGSPPWWEGMQAAFWFLVASFLLGGLVSLGLLAARRVRRGTAIPFGPFLLLGALLAAGAGGAP